MTRICIISDSSVNSIKSGWPLVESEYPDCKLTYFAAGRTNMETLEVADGRLISRDEHCAQRMRVSSNGLEGISDDYDWFLLFALGFNFNFVVNLCMSHRVECDEADERVPLSDACFGCMVDEGLRNSISIATVLKLREITEAPIAVVPAPMRCRVAIPLLRRLRDTGVEREVKVLTDEVAKSLADEHRFRLFLQPDRTLASPLVTNSMYARVPGSTDGHMNAAFGKEVWNAFLNKSPEGIL